MAQFESIRFQSSRPLLKELSADRLNTILQEIRRNKPKGERGITVRQTGDGTMIGLASAPKVAGGTSSALSAWDLIEVDSDESSATLKVNPGTINGLLPANWDEEFEVSKDQTNYAKLVIATNGRSFNSVNIEIDTTPPPTQVPQRFAIASEIRWLFGIYYEGAAFNLTGGVNITASSRLWLVASPESPAAPGESPFDLFFQVS